jgi:hypothetical protein
MNIHPTDAELLAWLDGEAAPEHVERTATHVEHCVRCQHLLDAGASLGQGLRVWADETVPATDDAFVDQILQAALATAPTASAASATPAPSAPSTGATVTALNPRRRWQPVLTVATVLAAAAAMVITLRTPSTPEAPSAPVVAAAPAATEADPGGSEVLAVNIGGEHTSYSVVEVQGAREGSTVAVVWIEDGS